MLQGIDLFFFGVGRGVYVVQRQESNLNSLWVIVNLLA